jgi:hypothetical protein
MQSYPVRKDRDDTQYLLGIHIGGIPLSFDLRL